MNKADELRYYVRRAKERLSCIGAYEEHLNSYGTLHFIVVKSVINYQGAPSSKNYHEDEQFDKALAEVIKEQFLTLSTFAIIKMQDKANDALIEEEDYLLERLKKIEELKNS